MGAFSLQSYLLFIPCSGSQVTIKVQLEREDEDIAPDVIAPFFPLVCIPSHVLNVYTSSCIVYLCVYNVLIYEFLEDTMLSYFTLLANRKHPIK